MNVKASYKRNLIGEFVECIQRVRSLEELNQSFDRVMQKFHFDRYAYQLIKNEHYNQTDPLIVATYPKEWVQYYIDQKYQVIDPVITIGPKKLLPFTWGSLWDGINLSKKQKKFFQEAEEFSVASGLGFPIHGPDNSFAMITMAAATDRDQGVQKIFEESEDTLHMLSLYYHQAACTLLARNDNIPIEGVGVHLTPRETEVLKWAYENKSNSVIADILNISQNSVDFHFKNIRAKMGVFSKQEAVVRAVMLKLIKL